MITKLSLRMRIPRSGHPHLEAMSPAVEGLAPIAVKSPRSIAAFNAAVFWKALIVSKKSWGEGGASERFMVGHYTAVASSLPARLLRGETHPNVPRSLPGRPLRANVDEYETN